MIKKILIVVLSLPFLVIGLAYLLPASTEVSRSIDIGAPSDKVFQQVNDLRNWQNWSPWAEKDPRTEYQYEGPVSGGGARMSWKSNNPKVGEGAQEIVESQLNKFIDMDLAFSDQGPAKVYFHFDTVDEQSSRLIWRFVKEHGSNPVNRYMGLLFDSWLGPDFEKGLKNIKALVENPGSMDEEAGQSPAESSKRVMYVDEQGKPTELAPQETQQDASTQPKLPDEVIDSLQQQDAPVETSPSQAEEQQIISLPPSEGV